jgi:5-methylcytosine-specific restriction endonuclease McrA
MTTALIDRANYKKTLGIWWRKNLQWLKGNRNGGHCERCGIKMENRLDLEGHHIIPLCCGGGDYLWNIQLVCHDCHEQIHCMEKYK